MDTTVHPPRVSALHFEVDAWLGDDLVQSFPCYLVSTRLAERLRARKISGAAFAPAEVTASDRFAELCHERTLPSLVWLQVTGTAGVDDFGLDDEFRLVVSHDILNVMRQFHVAHCQVQPFVKR